MDVETQGEEHGQAGSPAGTRAARQPQRKPGKARFRKLLMALDELLTESNIQDVGLYQIAERAGVPTASAYHFFPGKEAAILALANHHHESLEKISIEQPLAPPATWQALFRQKVIDTASYYNANPSAMQLFFGANISAQVRTAEVTQYERLVLGRLKLLETYFHMPQPSVIDKRLPTYFAIVDGVFSLSYAQHRQIVEGFVAEAHTAGIAYLRCFLPEELVARPS